VRPRCRSSWSRCARVLTSAVAARPVLDSAYRSIFRRVESLGTRRRSPRGRRFARARLVPGGTAHAARPDTRVGANPRARSHGPVPPSRPAAHARARSRARGPAFGARRARSMRPEADPRCRFVVRPSLRQLGADRPFDFDALLGRSPIALREQLVELVEIHASRQCVVDRRRMSATAVSNTSSARRTGSPTVIGEPRRPGASSLRRPVERR
jgi:hypothetical protein